MLEIPKEAKFELGNIDDKRGHYKVNGFGNVVNDKGKELKQDKNRKTYLETKKRRVYINDNNLGNGNNILQEELSRR